MCLLGYTYFVDLTKRLSTIFPDSTNDDTPYSVFYHHLRRFFRSACNLYIIVVLPLMYHIQHCYLVVYVVKNR